MAKKTVEVEAAKEPTKEVQAVKYYTYIHCRPDGIPFYVGKGIHYRTTEFARRNQHHKNIVAKYGKENIQIIAFKKDSEESAFKSEIRLIRMLRNAGFELANRTNGGEGVSGYKHTKDACIKMSLDRIGNKHTDEQREKIAKSISGIKRSVETRLKISLARKGMKFSAKRKKTELIAKQQHANLKPL